MSTPAVRVHCVAFADLQQPNAAAAAVQEEHFWHRDGSDSTTMNLEPNFPCCTGNFNQGWPKFATNLAAVAPGNRSAGATLALSMLAPCSISANLHLTQSAKGVATYVNVTTSYPWGSAINVSIAAPSAFTFAFRVPSWAGEGAALNGKRLPTGSNGTLHRVAVGVGKTQLRIVLPMRVRIQRRYNGAASVYRGPLLYSLDLPSTATHLPYCVPVGAPTDGSRAFCSNATYQVEQHGYQYTNASAWNYGIDAASLEFEQVAGTPNAAVPFSSAGSPVVIRAKARQIDWGTVRGSAAAPPASPVKSAAPEETLRMIPYGATHGLSLVELPTLPTLPEPEAEAEAHA